MDATTTVSAVELAGVLGLNRSRISALVTDGVLTRANRSAYPLFENVQKYIEFTKRKSPSNLDSEKLAAEVRIKTAKASILELEEQELRGKFHRAEDVEALTEDLIYAIRGALNALPGRCAMDVAELSSPAACADVIRKEVNGVLSELATYRYDPALYEERVRDRRKWEAKILSDEEEEESKKRGRPKKESDE